MVGSQECLTQHAGIRRDYNEVKLIMEWHKNNFFCHPPGGIEGGGCFMPKWRLKMKFFFHSRMHV